MNRNDPTGHLAPERLQALLEGELSPRERARTEEHLTACARCAAELDTWKVLLEDLDDLVTLTPRPGFAERVMTDARLSPTPAGVGHVAADMLQEYLDGMLAARRAESVEAHLATCRSCSAEADAWASLHVRLEGLGRYAPAAGFADRVLAAVEVPERLPLVARARDRVLAIVRPGAAHVHAGRLQDYADGHLSGRAAARVRSHLAACSACAEETRVWTGLVERLGSLPRFAPEVGFAERVVSAVRRPVVAAPVRQSAPAWGRALAVARGFLPRTRRAWAAISGMAVTPAVTAALVLYTVFSHPTLTPGALASFVWWQITDVSIAAWAAVSGALLQSAELFGVYSLFEAIASAPVAVACGAVLYSLGSALALRVLYRNVVASRPVEGRYVRVSAS